MRDPFCLERGEVERLMGVQDDLRRIGGIHDAVLEHDEIAKTEVPLEPAKMLTICTRVDVEDSWR